MYHDDGEHSSLNLIHLIHSTKSLRCLRLLNSLCLAVFVCWLQVVFVQKGEICLRCQEQQRAVRRRSGEVVWSEWHRRTA